MSKHAKRIWTIGHSTRTIEDFIAIRAHKIRVVADVRQFPGSRRYPQFNREQLLESLAHNNIRYVHFPELGGRRKPTPDSPNTNWRNAAFRGYADYMESQDFRLGIDRLRRVAQKGAAIMCAEAVWWRCHRSLIADYLKVRGVEVLHIMDRNKIETHPFTSAARLIDGQLSYRANEVQPTLHRRS